MSENNMSEHSISDYNQARLIDIIHEHNSLMSEFKYEFVDPNKKTNELFGIKISQEEIKKMYNSSNITPSCLEVNYSELYLVKYSIENDKILISSSNSISAHLIRIIGIRKISNYVRDGLNLEIKIKSQKLSQILFEINLLLEDTTLNIMDYCTICGNNLEVKGIKKIQSCSNSECKVHYKNVVSDDKITALNLKDPIVCEFLINIMIFGSSHQKKDLIFKPIPIIYPLTEQTCTFEKFKKILDEQIALQNLNYEKISNSTNDVELHKKIGSIAYGLIISAITENYFSISSVKNIFSEITNLCNFNSERRLYDSNKNIKNISNEFDQTAYICFNYSHEIESKFPRKNFLFHGSSIQCWYPIIKNGLKVMSGTEFMTTGAVHGNGIYFSDSFNYSYSYASNIGCSNVNNSSFNNQTNLINCKKNIVGIFEILGDISCYKKCENIYVIADEKIILLRYLVIVDNKFCDFQAITNYFHKYLCKINNLNEKKITDIKNKRFNTELKLLSSNLNVSHVNVINELTYWEINLNNIGSNTFKLLVYFNDYPKFPPKIVIESERDCRFMCDQTNTIILPELQLNEWTITNNLTKIVDKICNSICSNI